MVHKSAIRPRHYLSENEGFATSKKMLESRFKKIKSIVNNNKQSKSLIYHDNLRGVSKPKIKILGHEKHRKFHRSFERFSLSENDG